MNTTKKSNANLRAANKAKNDEFYTMLPDIENELKHYKKHFKDKIVYLNCDDHKQSAFYKYFSMNFEHLGLKKLIATHYDAKKPAYKMVIEKDINGDGKIDGKDTIETKLRQNGDFRSSESIALLQEADIVVTNPPFSLFREYIAQLVEYNKEFLVVGSMNAVTYKEVFKLIQAGKVWLGNNNLKEFTIPAGGTKKFGNINWFTNLDHSKRHVKFIPYKKYKGNEKDYPKYDNYDAIEVSKSVDIPSDYTGYMGVPISFLGKLNPGQFEIIWQLAGNTRATASKYTLKLLNYKQHPEDRGGCGVINNTRKYARIVIKWKGQTI